METPTIALERASTTARAELEELRRRAAELEAALARKSPMSSEEAARQAVGERWREVAQALPPAPGAPRTALAETVTLPLAPEEHDEKMGEFIHVLQEHGIAKSIAAVEEFGSPHLVDDFHRVLVAWVHEGLSAKGLNAKPYRVPLSLTLYEVTLPQHEGKDSQTRADPAKALRDFIGIMEQFYRGMLQMDTAHGEYFSFEIANPAGAVHTSIYIAVPAARAAMFEKQLLSLYPSARLRPTRDDYNAFAEGAAVAVAIARLAERPIYALRTFEAFNNDPLETLLAAFSKLDETGEGASVQFVVSPRDNGLLKRFRHALQEARAGMPLGYVTKVRTGLQRVLHDIFVDTFFAPEKLPPEKRLSPDDPRLKNIETKVGSPILLANIRLVSSASSSERAAAILEDLEAPFRQFSDTAGNALEFELVPPRKVKKLAKLFSFRLFEESSALPLSAIELATLAHLPRAEARGAAPELRQEKSRIAAAPAELPQQGILLGINRFRGTETEVRVLPEDRLRHLYIVGQTGTGKSSLLKNIVTQDIKSGAGVAFIDPHGTDVLEVLSTVPPERIGDVIYFDPAHLTRPIGLNMLEYDPKRPEQKTLVVDELLGIFKKLFGAVPESMGPAFEQYFRNAALLVMESPELGNTLLDISRVFGDSEFRTKKLSACKNPIVVRFWQDIAMKAGGEQALENYGPYVTNKFDVFTTNEFVRPIIAQQKSAFNFRELMDTSKILLVNLAKGRIGDLNANLLGLVIVGKFLIAALSRADSFGKSFSPFYLHIDEFQNFATPTIATIFSEARKYKLSLTVAHQFIAQLTEEIRDSVFGNIGNICAFRIGADDAEFLEKQFAPVFTAADLMRVDNFNAHLKLLVNGQPTQPFNIETLPFERGSLEHLERVQELSFITYGRPREEIEADIVRRLSSTPPKPATLAGGVV